MVSYGLLETVTVDVRLIDRLASKLLFRIARFLHHNLKDLETFLQ